jgi:hypothetical protein
MLRMDQVQGYAHFFASNVWNDPAQSQCRFTYYKGFYDGTKHAPPYPVSCIDQHQWTEEHCPITGRAAEYDWLGFYTALPRDSYAPISHTELAGVYVEMCGGSICTTSKTSSWTGTNGLLKAAESYFPSGTLDPRYSTFNNAGSAYGVTR